MARMEEMTAGEGEPPPDPRDVDEWAWDTEEVRDFHRALEVRFVMFRCTSIEHQVFSLYFIVFSTHVRLSSEGPPFPLAFARGSTCALRVPGRI